MHLLKKKKKEKHKYCLVRKKENMRLFMALTSGNGESLGMVILPLITARATLSPLS